MWLAEQKKQADDRDHRDRGHGSHPLLAMQLAAKSASQDHGRSWVGNSASLLTGIDLSGVEGRFQDCRQLFSNILDASAADRGTDTGTYISSAPQIRADPNNINSLANY
jgi:hypothetical protein